MCSSDLLNLLDPHDPVAVDNLVAIFASIYRRSWGDRIAEAFRMGCQAVIADYHHLVKLETDQARDTGRDAQPVPVPTLRAVLNLLTKPATRHRIVAALQDGDDDPNPDPNADINHDIATYWAAFNNRSAYISAVSAQGPSGPG